MAVIPSEILEPLIQKCIGVYWEGFEITHDLECLKKQMDGLISITTINNAPHVSLVTARLAVDAVEMAKGMLKTTGGNDALQAEVERLKLAYADQSSALEEKLVEVEQLRSDADVLSACCDAKGVLAKRVIAERDALKAEVEQLKRDNDLLRETNIPLASKNMCLMEENEALRGILAVIHRDGGQHTEEVGILQSVEDAHNIWCGLRAEVEKLHRRIHMMQRIDAAIAKITREEEGLC